jgi:hypothetical protein
MRAIGHRRQVFEVSGLGELVEVDNLKCGILEGQADETRADKSSAPGNEDPHQLFIVRGARACRKNSYTDAEAEAEMVSSTIRPSNSVILRSAHLAYRGSWVTMQMVAPSR